MEALWRNEVAAAYEIVQDDLVEIERVIVQGSEAATPFLTSVNHYGTQAGGKRLRAALVVLMSRFGPADLRAVHDTAAAIELTHLATLHHDDVIDEADLRRGRASVPMKWGNTVAVLAGDYLFARASLLAIRAGGEIPRILATAMADLVEGQVRELELVGDPARSVGHYLDTIRGKTVALLSASASAGASLAGCPPEVRAAVDDFGLALGFAFQIVDDLLDLAADEDMLGKPPGTDLREGVFTLPVLYAIDADPSLREALRGGDPDVDAVRQAVLRNGAFERAALVAQEYVDRALSAIERLPERDVTETLDRLTRLVIKRVPIPSGEV